MNLLGLEQSLHDFHTHVSSDLHDRAFRDAFNDGRLASGCLEGRALNHIDIAGDAVGDVALPCEQNRIVSPSLSCLARRQNLMYEISRLVGSGNSASWH